MTLPAHHDLDLRATKAYRTLINEAATNNDLPRLREAITEHAKEVIEHEPEIQHALEARVDALEEAIREERDKLDERMSDALIQVWEDLDDERAKPEYPKATSAVADREKDLRARLLAEVVTTIEELGEDALPSGISHPEIADAIREAMAAALARAHDAGALEAIEAIESAGEIAE